MTTTAAGTGSGDHGEAIRVFAAGRPRPAAAAGNGWYRLKPAHTDQMALSVADSGTTNAPLVLAAKDEPWQLWSIKQELNGAGWDRVEWAG